MVVWNDRHWEIDITGRVMHWAKNTVKRLAHKLPDLSDDKAKALLAHIKTSLNTGRLTAMLTQAQCELAVKPEAFDQHPWLLNCANGTLDLRTGILRKHAREDLLTTCLTVPYDAAATCPKWDAFLNKIMGGSDTMLAFLQRMVGYATTGSTQEQKLFVCHGVGANGKSTFLNTLLALLGPYGMKATSDLLMMSKSDRHPTERTDLCGKRLVAAIETEQGRRLSEVFVKEATGGDRIRARRMREDNWEFSPTHTIVLASNHKPEIRGTDAAIWRRVALIPFTVTIAPDEQDKTLMAQLEAEFPGILAWIVRGCLAWQQDGLQVPAEVEAATADYKKEMDILEAFLAECCKTGPNYRTKAADLYDAYTRWSGDQAKNQRTWGMALTERGFERQRGTHGYYWWIGVGLVEPEDANKKRTTPSRSEPSVQDGSLADEGDETHAWQGDGDDTGTHQVDRVNHSEPTLSINSSNFSHEADNQKIGSLGSLGSLGRKSADRAAELPSMVRHAQPSREKTCPDPRCRGTVEDKYGAIRCTKCQKTEAELRALFPHAWKDRPAAGS